MKKIKYLILFCSMMLLTGCVKFNATMDIKKDKSMDFGIIYAVDTSLMGDQELMDENQKKEMQKEGFSVKDYSEDNYKGFQIVRNIPNIDKVSSTEDTEYSLSGILNNKKENGYIFKVKKGLIKNKYIADFKFDSNDSSLNSSNTGLNANDEEVMQVPLEGEMDNDFDISGMTGNMDLSFVVTLPYSALSNNATNAKNNNKELKWNLTTSGNDSIKFEFELYNTENLYIAIGAIAIIVIVLVIVIINVLGKKKPKQETDIVENNVNVQNEPVKDTGFTAREFASSVQESKMPTPIEETTVNVEPEMPKVAVENELPAEDVKNDLSSFVPEEVVNPPQIEEEQVVNAFSQGLVSSSTTINEPTNNDNQ